MSESNKGANVPDDALEPVSDLRVPTPPPPQVTPESVAAGVHVAAVSETKLDLDAQIAAEVAKQVAAIMAASDNPELARVKRALEDATAQLAALREKQAAEEAGQLRDYHNLPGVANASRASTKARYAITLEEARDSADAVEVFVQVNGRAYQIKRGLIVEVPPEVVNVLNDAVIDKTIVTMDARGMPEGFITRKARRFPFTLHGKTIDESGTRIRTIQADIADNRLS